VGVTEHKAEYRKFLQQVAKTALRILAMLSMYILDSALSDAHINSYTFCVMVLISCRFPFNMLFIDVARNVQGQQLVGIRKWRFKYNDGHVTKWEKMFVYVVSSILHKEFYRDFMPSCNTTWAVRSGPCMAEGGGGCPDALGSA
jgi:hypothetical protein